MKDIRGVLERRGTIAAAASAVIASFFALIVAAPWLMRSVVSRSDDWQKLSEMGQAYGGISAILSGLALCGIGASLLLQWRQIRSTQVITMRERHFELIKISLENPELAPPHSGIAEAERRQWMVNNLWVSHWAMLWDVGSINRPGLRRMFDDLFSDNEAINWWTACGENWASSSGRREQAFLLVVDEAYRAALQARSVTSADHEAHGGGVGA